MSDAQTPCPADHPMMLAWEAYKETEAFKNSKHWAMTVAPMIQVGDPDAERKRYELMPAEQRSRHVDGSLWAAFVQGWTAALTSKDHPR
jgi:hypothetical protein